MAHGERSAAARDDSAFTILNSSCSFRNSHEIACYQLSFGAVRPTTVHGPPEIEKLNEANFASASDCSAPKFADVAVGRLRNRRRDGRGFGAGCALALGFAAAASFAGDSFSFADESGLATGADAQELNQYVFVLADGEVIGDATGAESPRHV